MSELPGQKFNGNDHSFRGQTIHLGVIFELISTVIEIVLSHLRFTSLLKLDLIGGSQSSHVNKSFEVDESTPPYASIDAEKSTQGQQESLSTIASDHYR